MENEEIRKVFARKIAHDIDEHSWFENGGIVHSWTEEEHLGPMGGISSQVYYVFEADGELHGVIVNVYCDSRTNNSVDRMLQEEAEKIESAKRVKDTIRQIRINLGKDDSPIDVSGNEGNSY